MLTSKVKKITANLESEVYSLKEQIELFTSSCEIDGNDFVREEDLLHYFNLMGKMMFLNDCMDTLNSSFLPGGDLYEQDKEDYGEGFSSYYSGQLESLDLYLSIIKSCS